MSSLPEWFQSPRPKAKFPSIHLGGLSPPAVGLVPRRDHPKHSGDPYPVPVPKPPPRSLQWPPLEDTSNESTVEATSNFQDQPQLDPKVLVPPTSRPPDVCRHSRGSCQTALQHWQSTKKEYQKWFTHLILSIGEASQIFTHFAHLSTFATVVNQLLSHVGPSTLDLYSRSIETTMTWMRHYGVDWSKLTLTQLVQILQMAKEASRSDVQAIRLQPPQLLRGLKWLAKTALMEDLQNILNSFLMSSFLKGSGEPRDRKEALPIPFILVLKWEQTIMKADTPDWLRLLLGGFLLAIWSSLRYADLQRTSVSNLNLGPNAIRGLCRLTKTTRTGQPFAAYLGGFSSAAPRSGWVASWLRALQRAYEKSKPFQPDYIIPVLDNYDHPSMASPLSYAGALRALRWAAQTPWSTPTLSSLEAQGLTLHSLKVTFLSAAAQLRLPRQDRQMQGHHIGGSVQLYSRDDTVDAIWLQMQICKEVKQGWRPSRPLQRGGQPALPEPRFDLPNSELPMSIEILWERGLSLFQESKQRMELNETISLKDSESSDDSSSDCSESDDDETVMRKQQVQPETMVFVQNGPSGCCHVATEAILTAPANRTLAIGEKTWSTKCGASIRSSAMQVTFDQIKWPCQRKACRAVFDSLIHQSAD